MIDSLSRRWRRGERGAQRRCGDDAGRHPPGLCSFAGVPTLLRHHPRGPTHPINKIPDPPTPPPRITGKSNTIRTGFDRSVRKKLPKPQGIPIQRSICRHPPTPPPANFDRRVGTPRERVAVRYPAGQKNRIQVDIHVCVAYVRSTYVSQISIQSRTGLTYDGRANATNISPPPWSDGQLAW